MSSDSKIISKYGQATSSDQIENKAQPSVSVKLVLTILVELIVSAYVLFGSVPNVTGGILLSGCALVASLALIPKGRHCWPLFITYLLNAYSIYSIFIMIYFRPIPGLLWTSLSGSRYSLIGSLALFVYELTLYMALPEDTLSKKNLDATEFPNSRRSNALCMCVLIICTAIGLAFYGMDTSGARIGGGKL